MSWEQNDLHTINLEQKKYENIQFIKRSCKGAKYFIFDKIACYEHATVPKMNSHTAPLNRNSLRIEAKNKNKNKKIIIKQYK